LADPAKRALLTGESLVTGGASRARRRLPQLFSFFVSFPFVSFSKRGSGQTNLKPGFFRSIWNDVMDRMSVTPDFSGFVSKGSCNPNLRVFFAIMEVITFFEKGLTACLHCRYPS
jgi:hypothetical protein